MKRTLPQASQPLQQQQEEEEKVQDEFFASLQFDKNPFELLHNMPRQPCPQCKKSKKFYCHECMIPLTREDSKIETVPHVTLPVKCIVIQHPNERKEKSTAIHAKIIAPESVEIYQYPEIPESILDPKESILVYPTKDAITVEDLIKERSDAPQSAIKNIIFIDSTWQQSKAIVKDERLRNLRRIKIESHDTKFWRYQSLNEKFLSTIEAIYFFYKEWSGLEKVDNMDKFCILYFFFVTYFFLLLYSLLYYFTYNYHLIQGYYKNNPNKKFTRIENYIQYEEEGTNKKQKIA